MLTAQAVQKIQFSNGVFTPSEARDVVSKVIDEQINFYKLQHLSKWVKNNNISNDSLDKKIAQLSKRKQEIAQIIKEAQIIGSNVNLSGDFKISLEKY